jgi:phage I-like protein
MNFKNSFAKEVSAASEPKWNQLFVQGTFFREDFPDGLTLDVRVFESMVENWKAAGRPELPVDYFHWGASHMTSVPVEEKIASGWIKRIRVRNGVLEGLIQWTDKARAKIEAQELRYFSPYFQMDGLDRTTGKNQGPTLFGGGLLNDPFLQSLPAVAASAVQTPTPETAKTKESQVNEKLKKAVCAAFGLAPTATDEEILAAATKMTAAPIEEEKEEMPMVVSASKTTSATPAPVAASANSTANTDAIALAVEPVRTALAAAVAQTKELSAKIEKLENEKSEAKTIALTEKLFSQGRLLPANRDTVAKMVKAIGHDEAEKYFSAMPVVVDLSQRGIQATGDTGVDNVKKFESLIDSLSVEKKISRSAARELAMAQNPSLAVAAYKITSTKES